MSKFTNSTKLIAGAIFSVLGFILGVVLSLKAKDVAGTMVMFYFLGIAAGPYIFYEFANPRLKIYIVAGPIGIAFIKLSIKIFTFEKKITTAEIEKLKKYISKEFGNDIGKAAENYIKAHSIIPESIHQICIPITKMSYVHRIGFVTQMFSMIASDNHYNQEEELIIQKIAYYLHIGKKRYTIIKSGFIKKSEAYHCSDKKNQENGRQKQHFINQFFEPIYNPYIILGLETSASVNEIKRTYREEVKKYHPDVLTDKTEITKKQAKEKFLEINVAYEKIKKMRGIK